MNAMTGPCDRGVILGSCSAHQPSRSGTWVLIASILGSSLAFIDGTAVNVALPALQTSLNASLTDIQWVIEAYTLFLGALLLTGGSLGDLFGYARVFVIGTFLFAAGSIWCGLSPDVHQLILARSLQGLGGALLVPNSLALLSATFPAEKLAGAIGTWSAATSITSAAGPVLGGWLTQHASWRWVFFINLPISAAILLIGWFHLFGQETARERAHIDWIGTVFATLGLGGVVYGFLQSDPLFGWLGAACLVAFVYVEWRVKAPMLPLGLFRSGNFTGTGILTLLLYGALSGVFFFLPLNLVQVQGYSETAAGAALLPMILLIASLSHWSARLLDRYSPRVLLFFGPCVAAVGLAMLAAPGIGGSYWTTFFPAVVVLGLGMAITVAPLTTTVMESVDKAKVGIASGANNAISRIAGLLSIAVFGSVMKWVAAHQIRASAGPPVSDGFWVKQGFVDGFRVVAWLCAGLAFVGAIASAIFVRGRASR